jgi:hypothetical protein
MTDKQSSGIIAETVPLAPGHKFGAGAMARAANPSRLPSPPLTLESIQNLSFEDIEP